MQYSADDVQRQLDTAAQLNKWQDEIRAFLALYLPILTARDVLPGIPGASTSVWDVPLAGDMGRNGAILKVFWDWKRKCPSMVVIYGVVENYFYDKKGTYAPIRMSWVKEVRQTLPALLSKMAERSKDARDRAQMLQDMVMAP